MAQRRSITHHPAFVPFVAAWSAALFGLAVAVLPTAVVQRALAGAGLADVFPAGAGGHALAGALAALVGGLAGLAVARIIEGRGHPDPRPVFREETPEVEDETAQPAPVRRPLRVHEELLTNEGMTVDAAAPEESSDISPIEHAEPATRIAAAEGFMILTPQPVHPRRTAIDLDTLLDQFDHAIASYQADSPAPRAAPAVPGPDPVHSFVARQTGAPAPAPSPLGGLVPDHQAELRAALDKLAKAMRQK